MPSTLPPRPPRLRSRLADLRSLLRWHLPVSRQGALDMAEQNAAAYFDVAFARAARAGNTVDFLTRTLSRVISAELSAEWDRAGLDSPVWQSLLPPHPESLTAVLPECDEKWLAAVAADLWPHDEYEGGGS